MKILVMNYEFPPIGGGGGAVARDVCSKLAERGHQIQVQTAHWGNLPKYETQAGYRIRRSFSFRRRTDRCSVPEMGLYALCNAAPALAQIRRFKPDVIHVHFAVPTGLPAIFAHMLTGVPYVLTLHLGDVPGAMPGRTDHLFRIVKPLAAPIWRRAAHITAVSEHVAELGRKAYGLPVTCVPNGVVFPQTPPNIAIPDGPVHLLFAGRFAPQKNLLFLIQSLAAMTNLPWRCTLAGDGPLAHEIRAAVKSHGLEDRIHLPGWVSRNQVSELMRDAQVLLMPSLFEGLPVVAVTALTHGLAIVGSDIGGLQDLIQHHQNGLSLPTRDPQAFSHELGKLISNPDRLKQMRQAAFEHSRKFDLEQVIDAYEHIFQEVASKEP